MAKHFAINETKLKSKARAKKGFNGGREDDCGVKRSMLMHSAVVSVRNPSKKSETICKQLRKILSPDCLSKIEINPKIQDIVDASSQLLIKQIICVSEDKIKVALLPSGPTYLFKIIGYEDNFKNYTNDIYKSAPFITFEGKSSIKTLFQNFGTTDRPARRALHFHFDDSLVHIRHYFTSTENTDDNFVVRLKEIGPKLTLELVEAKNGIFPDMSLKLRQRHRPL